MITSCNQLKIKRSGVSLVETVIVMMIMAIAAAAAIPSWSASLEATRLQNATQAVKAEIALLRRLSIRSSEPVSFTVNVGDSTIQLGTAIPLRIGNAAGELDYASRFPGVTFSACDFDGSSTLKINIYGELINSATDADLSSATIVLTNSSGTQTLDLLGLSGRVSAIIP